MTRPLVHLAEVALGRQRSPEHERGDHMTPYLRSANIADGELDLTDVKEMNFSPREVPIYRLRDGDVLVTEGSGSRDTVGTSAVWRGEIAGTVCFQNTLLRIRARPGNSDARYLAWWARYAHASRLFSAVATGANILHLSAEQLRRLPIPAIPLSEQRIIANFLDGQVARIDNIIAAREQQLVNIRRFTESTVIEQLLDTQSPPQSEQASGLLFEVMRPRWPVMRLSRVWEVIDCKHRTPVFVDAGYPVISPGDIEAAPLDPSVATRFVNDFDYQDLADEPRRCRVGDVVYSRNASAGTAALVVDDTPFTMGQDVCRITSGLPSQEYLFYVLNFLVKDQLELARIGSTFTRINIEEIKALQIPVPDYPVQKTLNRAVRGSIDDFDRNRDRIERSLQLFRELKRSLITSAVSGEFDVSAADGSRVLKKVDA